MQLIKLTVAFVFAAIASALPHTTSLTEHVTRGATPAFINADGTVNLPGLCGSDNIKPFILPPNWPTVNTTSSSDSKVSGLLGGAGLASLLPSVFNLGTKSTPFNVYVPSTFGNAAVPQFLSYNAFVSWPSFAKTANAAPATCGSGNNYSQVYKNQSGTYYNPQLNSWLAQTTHYNYDPNVCAAKCDSITGCMSFDIYYERDPITDPKAGTIFANPASITNIVCSYYGIPITPGLNTDVGKTIASFQTAKAGVDGYTKPFPSVAPPLPGYTGAVYTGGLDNRIATGNGAAVGPQYANYNTYAIQYTSHLTSNPYFDPIFCKQVADGISGALSFDTFPILVGGDPQSQPYSGAGGRYSGQGCVVFSEENFPPELFDDPGQYGHDDVTGKDGAYFTHSPNFHYDKNT